MLKQMSYTLRCKWLSTSNVILLKLLKHVSQAHEFAEFGKLPEPSTTGYLPGPRGMEREGK